jgi:hypothetical protein
MKADVTRNHVQYISTVTNHLERVHDSPNKSKLTGVLVTLYTAEKLLITTFNFLFRNITDTIYYETKTRRFLLAVDDLKAPSSAINK